jgi:hypothetical protein
MNRSDRRRIKKEADKYFRPLKNLDIGKEYLKVQLGKSSLPNKTKEILLDYIKIRCSHETSFNEFISHLNGLVKSSVDKIKYENSNIE